MSLLHFRDKAISKEESKDCNERDEADNTYNCHYCDNSRSLKVKKINSNHFNRARSLRKRQIYILKHSYGLSEEALATNKGKNCMVCL